ncbi:MAG: 30S ribosomal protein S3, partial [Bacteroidetes bacterium]|nr:30S ribosomal protein S3 [Bacteroidota bacterium]
MGQKTHPIGFRLGIIRGWDSNWYTDGSYAEKLVEDDKIRKYLHARLKRAGLSRVVIERTPKRVILTLHTSRPGVVIGRGGAEVEKLREELKKLTEKDIQININEIKRPELDASLVAQNIAQQLEGRISFRRAMKQALGASMRMGAQGIRIKLSGRLGGAEMGRTEQYMEGRVPLHTLRADIDYADATAFTIQGQKYTIRLRKLYDLPFGDFAILVVGGKPAAAPQKTIPLKIDDDTTIEAVYLAHTGGHLKGFLNKCSVTVSSPDNRVDKSDMQRAVENAKRKHLPPGRVYIHHIRNGYRLDGRPVENPASMRGEHLEVGYW